MKIQVKDKWEGLIDQYQNLIFSICYRMTQDYHAAQDLAQETFLSAFRNERQFDGGNEKAWLCRIASNKCIDYLRQANRRQVPTEEENLAEYPANTATPEQVALDQDTAQTLLENCRKLKKPYDEIAYLYFYQEKRPEEIAEIQNRKLKTVQTQIYRARDMMRELYQAKKHG